MCDRWRDNFQAFQADLLPTYRPGMTLERIRNNEGYSPENCRWATRAEQNRNQRKNIIVDTPQGRMILADAAALAGINYHAMWQRYRRGQPLFAPFGRWKKHLIESA